MRRLIGTAVLLFSAIALASAQDYKLSTLVSGVVPLGPMPPLQVSVWHVGGVAADRAGNIYFSSYRDCVFKVNPQNELWRVAGTCISGDSGDGGPATSAQLSLPEGLAVDPAGNLYIADASACRIRKVTVAGTISTVAGSGMCRPYSDTNAPAASPALSLPTTVAVDAAGNIFIAEYDGVRRFSAGGEFATVAPGLKATALAVDAGGTLFIASGAQIFKVAGGQMTTFAGKPEQFGDLRDGGPAIDASFRNVYGLTVDSAGNVIVADGSIRSISPDGLVHTVVSNSCCPSLGYGINSGPLAVDPSGNFYIGFLTLNIVRKVSPAGDVTTVAGTDNPTYVGDNGPAIDAQLSTPEAVAVDTSGNVFIADFFNSRIRKISTHGEITTVAGNGTSGFSGDGGPATSAQIAGPDGLAIDSAGNLFIAEYTNNRVRKVTTDGTITTVAGSNTCCDPGDGGLAIAAPVPLPHGIAVDAAGNLYIAEWPDSRIRKVTPSGVISTYAGTGTRGFSGDGGLATEAQLNCPWGLAVDGKGNLFFADNQNLRIRKISPDGIITTILGGPNSPYYWTSTGITADFAGNVFTSDGWMIPASGDATPIQVRSGNRPVFVSGVGITIDPRGDLFVVSGNRALRLERPGFRLPTRRNSMEGGPPKGAQKD